MPSASLTVLRALICMWFIQLAAWLGVLCTAVIHSPSQSPVSAVSFPAVSNLHI
jgi:hypothetical protein